MRLTVETGIRMERQTDNETVRRVLDGDTEAFGVLVERYSGMVYSLAARVLRDDAAAEDCTQEAFVRAFERLKGFRGESAFGTWVGRIAYHRAVELLRRRPTRTVEAERSAELAAAPEPADERIAALRRALESLSPEERTLVTLFYDEEYPVAEIARILRLSESNVKVRLHRVRRRLRELIEKMQ